MAGSAGNYEPLAAAKSMNGDKPSRDAANRTFVPSVQSGATVALTGGASFLGTNLIGLLEEDERVGRIVSIDIKAPSTAGKKTRCYEVDFTQPAAEARLAEILAADRVETLVHLAFLAQPS